MFKLYIECPQADYLGQTAININDQQLTENINLLRNRPAHEMLFGSHTP